LESLQSDLAPLAWSAFIAPPHIPYAPAFASHGLDVNRLLVVRPKISTDALWSMEQALRSGLFAAVLGWFVCIDMPALRRLQLAAEAGMCWAVMFRPARFARDASPAALRILLQPENNAVLLQILRNRFGLTGSLSVQC
jgi:cell division inhibitor SulA/protein ImuA